MIKTESPGLIVVRHQHLLDPEEMRTGWLCVDENHGIILEDGRGVLWNKRGSLLRVWIYGDESEGHE